MPKIKVTLSIGYPSTTHKDILEINDDEYMECETEDDRQKLLNEYWEEWAWNYIDGGAELIDD